jgi:hypothetical protein
MLTNLLALLPVETIENWQKITQYFWVLAEILRTAPLTVFNKMIKEGLVTKMIDFILENQSPLVIEGKRPAINNTMGNYNTKPDLSNFITALSIILRRYPTVDLKNEPQVTEDHEMADH